MIRFRTQLMILFAVLGVSLFFASSVSTATQWVNDPNNCVHIYDGVNCATDIVCGYNGVACYNPALLSPPVGIANSVTQYSGSFGAGYILNCLADRDAAAPYCDNSTAMWCNASTTCTGYHRFTTCAASKWAGDSGAASCGSCQSGYNDCNADGLSCEIHDGDACITGGGLPGHYLGCSGAVGNCVAEPQHFITGINAEFATSSPLLWGTQHGDGDLVSIAKNGVSTSTFLVSNSGQVGIGLTSVHATAALEVSSTSRGVLFTRLTTVQRDGIAVPPEGLLIYNIDNNQFEYFATSSWMAMGAGGAITYSADGEGLELTGTVFSIELDGATLFKSASGLRLSTTTVSAGTYGSSTEMVIFTVDAYGRLTAVSTTTLSFSSSDLMDSSTIAYLDQDQTFTGQNTFANTTTFNSTTLFGDQVLINTTTATSTLNLKVAGKIGANYYCDVNGENCFDPTAGLVTLISDITSTPVGTFSGSFTTGTLKGYQAANDICNYYYPDYHLCFSGEIITFIRTHSIVKFADLPQSWIAEGPPGYTAYSNDCNGYTTSSMTYLGALWDYDSDGGGQGWLTGCNNTRAIGCCK